MMNDEDKEFASLRRFGLRCCPYCGDHEVYRSRTAGAITGAYVDANGVSHGFIRLADDDEHER